MTYKLYYVIVFVQIFLYPYEGEKVDDLESLERLMDNLRRQQSWVERAKSFFVDLTSAVGAGVAMLLLVALPVMLLWNAVATEVFNLNRIGYFQSCGLILLTRILFATSGHKKE